MPDPEESYYDLLNVHEDATPDEIAASYRKLAKVLHPDVCKDPQAEELFKIVNQAYQVLRDPKKRGEYDLSLREAEESQFGEYYRGAKRYRDPRTWYYAHMHQSYSGHKTVPETEHIQPKRILSIPRIIQVFLFYATLLMAVIIIVQLFLLPWMEGLSASDARNNFEEGNRWMDENEYQKAIDSYTLAVTKLQGFSEGWRAKGLAEFKKAEELSKLGFTTRSEEYYSSSVISLLKAYKAFPDDFQVISTLGYALAASGDYKSAVVYLKKAENVSPNDKEISKKLNALYQLISTSVP